MERRNRMRLACLTIAMISLHGVARADMKTNDVDYKQGDVALRGYLAYDDKVKEPRPGVILVHEWWGLTDHMKALTREIAELGYVALAIDMYGKGVVTDKSDEASKLAGQFKDDKLRRERAKAGYDALLATNLVDKSRVAAIGFCFGGTTVLHMAYSGLDLAGVVSFHGSLVPPGEADAGKIKAKILVLHGADDPLVSAESIAKFQEGVRKAKADWQMMYYGGAVHSFTNPGADKAGNAAVKYDTRADKRSRTHMKAFFDEVLAKK
jgi:dienelactone hydrolase